MDQPGIDYDIHPKLNQDCKVVIEELLTLPLTIWKVTERRQSVRLQGRYIPSMKEPKLRKFKKKAKALHSNDKHESTVLLGKTSESSQTSTEDSQSMDLTDNDIINLFNDVACYIEDGVWDSAADILNSNEDLVSDPNTITEQGPPPFSTQAMVNQTIPAMVNQRTIPTEIDLPIRSSAAIQTDFDNQRSVSTETVICYQRSQSTQTRLNHQRSTSTQTSFESNSHTTTDSRPITKTNATSTRELHNRTASRSIGKYEFGKICKKEYGWDNYFENREYFGFEIPKRSKKHGGSYDKSGRTYSDFNSMKLQVLNLLQRPCLKFLKFESCDPFCQLNHFLPAASVVSKAISNWNNETIEFLYVTYIQRYRMCHLLYFEVINNIYAQRQSPENILATVKDCERMSSEGNLKIILLSLIKCGYSVDDGLYAICRHGHCNENAMNEILKIIILFEVTQFKRTIAFLVTVIETYDFDPSFGDEILKQASQVQSPDVTLLEFCCDIVRKFPNTLNENYMKELLSKM